MLPVLAPAVRFDVVPRIEAIRCLLHSALRRRRRPRVIARTMSPGYAYSAAGRYQLSGREGLSSTAKTATECYTNGMAGNAVTS